MFGQFFIYLGQFPHPNAKWIHVFLDWIRIQPGLQITHREEVRGEDTWGSKSTADEEVEDINMAWLWCDQRQTVECCIMIGHKCKLDVIFHSGKKQNKNVCVLVIETNVCAMSTPTFPEGIHDVLWPKGMKIYYKSHFDTWLLFHLNYLHTKRKDKK